LSLYGKTNHHHHSTESRSPTSQIASLSVEKPIIIIIQ